MAFSGEEIDYLRSQPVARLATVNEDGQPDVVPVAFELDGPYIWVGGVGPASHAPARCALSAPAGPRCRWWIARAVQPDHPAGVVELESGR
jgi:hypothetical protein